MVSKSNHVKTSKLNWVLDTADFIQFDCNRSFAAFGCAVSIVASMVLLLRLRMRQFSLSAQYHFIAIAVYDF